MFAPKTVALGAVSPTFCGYARRTASRTAEDRVAASSRASVRVMVVQSSTSLKEHTVTELAHRTSNGLDVILLWSRRTGRLIVSVTDIRTDEAFTVDAPRQRALDVYHHPFAYAAMPAA
jgi:hypothetical protein